MKTKHIVLAASTILWGAFIVSQTNMIGAAGTPISYPVTYPTPTVRPTPTAVPSSTPMPGGVHFQTQTVKLDADSFYIVAGNQVFTSKNSVLGVHSDPGNPSYTTLELIWYENGVEMRMNIYFQSDGKTWKSNEIRTYNGQKQGNWIYYYGTFFQSMVGQVYHNANFTISSSTGGIKGTIHFTNLSLQAFTRPTPTPTVSPTVRPTPTAVPSMSPRPTPTSYPVTYPVPTPTPIATAKISGKIYLVRFPFSRSKVDYSKVKVMISSTKGNFTINLPVDKNGDFSISLVTGTYKITPVGSGITFYPQSTTVTNIKGFGAHVAFFGLIF